MRSDSSKKNKKFFQKVLEIYRQLVYNDCNF